MDMPFIVPVLFLVTALAVVIFALRSKSKVEERMEDPNARKSTLAEDAPSDGKPAI